MRHAPQPSDAHWTAAGEAQARRQRRAPIANGMLLAGTLLVFGAVACQLFKLGLSGKDTIATLAVSDPIVTTYSRPDILDRNGRLLATDVEVPSLFADPSIVIDRDEVVEKLATVLTDIDQKELRKSLADKARRFAWIRRGLSPAIAQRIHNLGLPGLAFRSELRRAYPAGELAGHVIGATNVDNKGTAGIEKYIDDQIGVETVHSATLSAKAPVRLSLDLGVQHALDDELDTAVRRYHTRGAAGLVLDIKTGEVIAAASLPRVDPARPEAKPDADHLDKIAGSTFELGSVFKTLTLAMAFDEGLATPETVLDVRAPLQAGAHTITDFHPSDRPLSVSEIFTHSSNVGAGMLALAAGPERMQAFLTKLGLLDALKTETGTVSLAQKPERWDRAELITVSYGHGLAVAPLQFASAAAALLNGGSRLTPTFLKAQPGAAPATRNTVNPATSRQIARLFRLNVIGADGTGKRADVPGYRVGGKTGTADLAAGGVYESKAVISSFAGAFPMDDPKYLTFVMLLEPKGTEETGGQRTASTNAAPVTGRLVARIASQLGVEPLNVLATR